ARIQSLARPRPREGDGFRGRPAARSGPQRRLQGRRAGVPRETSAGLHRQVSDFRIAQVAATAGHHVVVADASPGAAEKAQARISESLQVLVAKGKMTREDAGA